MKNFIQKLFTLSILIQLFIAGCLSKPRDSSYQFKSEGSIQASGLYAVATYHNDNFRTGVNPNEYTLNPRNVTPATFGKLGSFRVDSAVAAQPLYIPNIFIPTLGLSKNILIVATIHDSIFAFDADGNSTDPIWKKNYLNPATGVVPVYLEDVGFASPNKGEIGIVGTPVVDTVTSTAYFVSKENNNGTYEQHLHAIDMATGDEKMGGPVLIEAKVPGVGFQYDDNENDIHITDKVDTEGNTYFNSRTQLQRPGLALSDGKVYIAWGSHGDFQPYHGWLMSYEAESLRQVGALSTSPNGPGGGIWMAGGGVAIDTDGFAFVATGNGTFDLSLKGFGDSLLKIDPVPNSGLLAVKDYFTPSNQADLNDKDLDLGSGGVTLIPDEASPGQRLALIGGKEGTLYLVNRENLGQKKTCVLPIIKNADPCDDVVQSLTHIVLGVGGRLSAGDGIYNTPAFFNKHMYIHAGGDVLKVFELQSSVDNTYKFKTEPVAQSTTKFTQVGATTMISSHGNADAVVWEVQQDSGAAILHAYHASDFSSGKLNEIYNSLMAGTRDKPVGAVRFTNPVIANGHVYVPGNGGVDIYGLFNQVPQTVTLTLEKDYFEPGDRARWHLIGAPPKSRILWDSKLNGEDAENGADYNNFTDENGSWENDFEITADKVGRWTRTAKIGLMHAQVDFTISATKTILSVNSDKNSEFRVGEIPHWKIDGAKPQTSILWSTSFNSAATEENDFDYGHVTDSSGHWENDGEAWQEKDVGYWVKKIKIGSQIKTVAFNVVPATQAERAHVMRLLKTKL